MFTENPPLPPELIASLRAGAAARDPHEPERLTPAANAVTSPPTVPNI